MCAVRELRTGVIRNRRANFNDSSAGSISKFGLRASVGSHDRHYYSVRRGRLGKRKGSLGFIEEEEEEEKLLQGNEGQGCSLNSSNKKNRSNRYKQVRTAAVERVEAVLDSSPEAFGHYFKRSKLQATLSAVSFGSCNPSEKMALTYTKVGEIYLPPKWQKI